MTLANCLRSAFVPLALAALAGCGGRTTLGLSTEGDAGPDADSGGVFLRDGGPCVDLTVTAADQECFADQDCELVTTGVLCSQGCGCPGSTSVNAAAASRLASELAAASLPPTEGCPGGCADVGTARCVAGQCTRCLEGLGGPSGCGIIVDDGGSDDSGDDDGGFDGGSGDDDGGFDGGSGDDDGGFDGGSGDDDGGFDGSSGDDDSGSGDGGACVTIDLSTYDQSCTRSSDCILVLTGTVCSGECECGGQPINIDGQARYDQAIDSITFAACSCPVEQSPACVQGMCFLLPP